MAYLPTGTTDPNIAPPIFNAAGVQTGGSNLAAVQDLVNYINSTGCAKKYIGTTVPRNTCTNNWYFDMDLSFSQELPGPGRLFGRNDKIKLYATMDNFLNFLDQDWNAQKRRNFAGLQDVAQVSGVDAQGRYIFTGFNGLDNIAGDNQVNISSSVWRLKVGISYEF